MFEHILHTLLVLVSLAGLGLFLARLDRACRVLASAKTTEHSHRD